MSASRARALVAPGRRPMRTEVAVRVGRAAALLSRGLGRGDGTVIGGRLTLLIDSRALGRLGAGRWAALISGTNGKTTTTRLLSAALLTNGAVVTNPQGSNLPPGLVVGLGGAPWGAAAALEVDEAWLGEVAEALSPAVVVLLNLSRDQLDRVAEVRRLAARWRAVAAVTNAVIVANADDPLVAWAASPARQVRWVGAGQHWHHDAAGCPACDGAGRIVFVSPDDVSGDWACSSCGFRRPRADVSLDGEHVVTVHGRFPLALALPGRVNRANAAMAATAAHEAGVSFEDSLKAMRAVREIDGRYRESRVGQADVRLLLAKNPAGWAETLAMLAPAPTPVVVVINAHIADGRDPSWLWDVPFERLVGRTVVAAGERSRDLSVRLRYAEVPHTRVDDAMTAIAGFRGPVDVAANYTAMRELARRLPRERSPAMNGPRP